MGLVFVTTQQENATDHAAGNTPASAAKDVTQSSAVLDDSRTTGTGQLPTERDQHKHQHPLIPTGVAAAINGTAQVTLQADVHFTKVPTPISVAELSRLLTGYDMSTKQYLLHGFLFGFHLGYIGEQFQHISKNLPSALAQPDIVTEKLNKELALGRLSGPYSSPPLEHFRSSPIGLVPKKKPNQFRIIHHLSYPPGSSVNDGIPDDQATVSYDTVDDAIKAIKKVGQGCFLVKLDIESAFKIVPVHPSD